jgi:hypothetical protein
VRFIRQGSFDWEAFPARQPKHYDVAASVVRLCASGAPASSQLAGRSQTPVDFSGLSRKVFEIATAPRRRVGTGLVERRGRDSNPRSALHG